MDTQRWAKHNMLSRIYLCSCIIKAKSFTQTIFTLLETWQKPLCQMAFNFWHNQIKQNWRACLAQRRQGIWKVCRQGHNALCPWQQRCVCIVEGLKNVTMVSSMHDAPEFVEIDKNVKVRCQQPMVIRDYNAGTGSVDRFGLCILCWHAGSSVYCTQTCLSKIFLFWN